jgi:acetyl esterase
MLDPDIAEFQRRILADYARLGSAVYPSRAHRRRVAEQVRTPWTDGGPAMAESIERSVDGIRVRLHRPTAEPGLPVLVYLHGGGWTLFSIDTHDRLMRDYAARSGWAVLGIDYSLSPEVRFPFALDEIEAVLDWLRRDGSELGLDTGQIAIGGDSAGANLAIATALRLRGRGEPRLAGMLLNYGAFDTERRPSHDRFGSDDFMLNPDEMDAFWADYLAPGHERDPLARPLLAELGGLPPAFLCIAECDILADENVAMAERLKQAGVDVDARVYRGAVHSFLEAASISTLASQAIGDAAKWLTRLSPA